MADGPAGFIRGFTCPALLGIRSGEHSFSATGLLPPMASLSRLLHLMNAFITPCGTSHNPWGQAPKFGLIRVRSPLLTESLLFSLPPGTEMFQFPGYASDMPMDSACGTRHRYRVGSPIRTSPDRSLLTAPRGVSSFATSFVGSWRLGIHRVP